MACSRPIASGLLALTILIWIGPSVSLAQHHADGEDFHVEHGEGEASGTGASGDHGAGHGNTNPMSFDPDLAIFTALNFLILLAVLWKFAWGPIAAGLDRREQGIADNIAAAQATHEQAKLLLADYERKLTAAQGEVRGIMEEARRDAEHTQSEILAKARADARAERDRALREIEMATDQALKELAERSTNLAVDLAGKIVQAQLQPSDHARLIEQAMASFPKGNPANN
jgi:F-type H+-transporting ATPase subunit b